MSKNPAAPDTPGTDAPKTRSKLKLALLALAPLVLAGGGYGGWTVYADAAATDGAAETDAALDPVKVSAVPTEIAAETSFTHSFALAVMIARECGRPGVRALKLASDEEALADGELVNLSWIAASRRIATLDQKNCNMFHAEVRSAEAKAARIAEEKAAAEKKKNGH